MSKGSNTTSTSQTPTALPAYQQALGQLQSVAQTPYNPYSGEIVAGVNNQQQTGIGGINQNAYSALPYLQGAESTIQGAAQPLTQGQIQNYYSPYQQDVVNATEAQFNNQNAIQQQQVLGNAAAQGALGGDRVGVAQAVLAGQQQAQQAPVIAGLENQGYAQALQTAGQQFQQNPEQAAYGMASTGTALENAGLTGANAQVGAGTLEQQTQQAQDTAALQQYMQTQFMPESMLSWELPLLTGVGSQEGGTSQTTAPAPNQLAQYTGLGLAAAGLVLKKGGRVQGLQGGGVPGGFSPGSANPWLNYAAMPGSSNVPKPPQVPGQSGVQSPLQMASQASQLAHGLQGKGAGLFNTGTTELASGMNAGDLSALTGEDADVSSAALAALPFGENRGGRVQLRRGGTPVRAGLGMASFMPRRRFASGGGDSSSDDDVVNFPSDRFVQPPVPAGLYNNSAGEANPLENILKFQTYGQTSPYAPAAGIAETPRTAAGDELPPEITAGASSASAAPQAGVGNSALAFSDDGSRNATPSAPPDSVNVPPAKTQSAGDAERSGLHFGFGLMSPDAKMALMSAGLGMMASRSPFLGTAIGEGGLQGLGTYSGLKKQEQDVDLKVKQLNQAAKAEQDRIALATKHESDLYSKMTPAQQADIDFRQRNLERENLQPVKVGTDMSTGTDIYAVRDPTAPGGFRRIDPASFGAPHGTPMGTGVPVSSAAPAPGGTPAPSEDESLPAHSTPVAGETPDNVKPEILASLDPNVAAQVKALDEGRMAFPTGFALSKPYWQNMLRLVSQYDPSFDAVNYNARAKTRSDFVAGKSAQNITSFNTAIGHLDTLDKTVDDLGNTRFGWLNPALQSAKSAMGDTSFQESQKRFMAAKQAVTDELTRAFRGSGGNVHDIVGWEQTINQADSPAALHAATKAAVDLLRSRIESVGDQYNRGMGTTRDPLTMLSPHAQAAIARLSGEAPPQSSAPAAPVVDPRDAAALKANANNPAAAAAIDKKYGAGTAARLLGAQ